MPPRKTNATTTGPTASSSSNPTPRLAPEAVYFSMDERENSYRAKGRPKKPAFPHQSSTHPRLTPKLLARAGFYHTPEKGTAGHDEAEGEDDDTCTCFLCRKKLGGWSEDDDPFVEHARYEQCPWVALVCRDVVDELNGGEGSKRTAFSDPDLLPSSAAMTAQRLRTYGEFWPHEDPSVQSLAEAGWVFAPSKKEPDNVWCPLCEYSVGQWEAGDDPLEHHKKKIECPFFTATLTKPSKPGKASKAEGKKTRGAVQEAPIEDDPADVGSIAVDDDDAAEAESVAAPSKRGRGRGRGGARGGRGTRGGRGGRGGAGGRGRKKAVDGEEDEDDHDDADGGEEDKAEGHDDIEIVEDAEVEVVQQPEPERETVRSKPQSTSTSSRSKSKTGKGKAKAAEVVDVAEAGVAAENDAGRVEVDGAALEQEESAAAAEAAADAATEGRATKPLPKKRGRKKASDNGLAEPGKTAPTDAVSYKSSRRVAADTDKEDPSSTAALAKSTPTSKSTSRSKSKSTRPLDPLALAQELIKSPISTPTDPTPSAPQRPTTTTTTTVVAVSEGLGGKAVEDLPLTDEQRDMTLEQFLRTEYGRQFDQMRKDGEEAIKAWENRTKEARKRIEAS